MTSNIMCKVEVEPMGYIKPAADRKRVAYHSQSSAGTNSNRWVRSAALDVFAVVVVLVR